MKKQTVSASAAVAQTVATVKEQAGQLVAAIVATDNAANRLQVAGGQLASLFGAMLAAPAPIVEKVLTETFAQLRPVAEKNVGKKASEAEKADEWRRLANSAAVVARRVNKGAAGTAPLFGLFYIGLSKESGATVRVIQKPTPEQVRKALAHDAKACNAAVAALAAGTTPATAAKGAASKPAPTPAPHAACKSDSSVSSSEAAVMEICSAWNPGELEQLAARLLNLAAEKRAAIAKKPAAKKPAAAKSKKPAAKGAPVSPAAKSVPVATAPVAAVA